MGITDTIPNLIEKEQIKTKSCSNQPVEDFEQAFLDFIALLDRFEF